MPEPKVRFKMDDGSSFPAWNDVVLGDIATRVTRKNANGETDRPLTIASIEGLVDQRTYFGKTIASKDMTGYFLLKNGEYAYNKSYSAGYDYGSIKRLDKYDMGALSTLYICFALDEDQNTDFYDCYFNGLSWYNQMPQICAEGARNHGLLNVSPNDFFKIQLSVPSSKEEQQKIADFLSSVDEVIAASEEEVANLETQKKAVMKKIFTQEVRFKRADGSDFPEWEEVKVLDMLVQPITDGPHETPELVEDGVPFVSVEAIENGRVNLNKRRGNITKEYDELCAKKYKPQLYDVYMVKSGATTGKMGIVTIEDDVKIWSPLAAMRTASKTEAFFLFFMLQSDLLQKQVWTKLSLGNQPNLGMRALEEFDAVRPCLEEQRLIADFLSDFDEAIAAAKKELELWKELKKGLLQQMFV